MKNERISVPCKICGKLRMLSVEVARLIERGKKPNVCYTCGNRGRKDRVQPPKETTHLPNGRVRMRWANGRTEIRVWRVCKSCGDKQLIRQDQITPNCKRCTLRRTRRLFGSIPKPQHCPWFGGLHPVRSKCSESGPKNYRCSGLWLNCPQYDACLEFAVLSGWDGWVCSAPEQPRFSESVCPAELQYFHVNSADMHEFDPVYDNHLAL